MSKVSSLVCLFLTAFGILAGDVTAFADAVSPPFSAEQSKRSVNGRVLDSKNKPVEGVAVIQAGTNNGVMTDADGSFHI